MTPTEPLPRPGGDGPPVPPLWQATFDADHLAQLFADLASAAEVLSVQGKADPRRYAAADPLTLDAAHRRLLDGDLVGVQVRYRYDGQEWTDTILRAAGGYRLVRCQVPAGQ
ncbi:MAG TPA: hypothetical protein VM533_11345 [Fimbriiglobus sp.]|nr:hypothetical protein [Fimbriiglobus sp.]